MQKIIKIIQVILSWIKGLFTSKKVKSVEERKGTLAEKLEKRQSFKRKNQRLTPPHNNRKNTRGRFTQYIHMGNGIYRAIYHEIASPNGQY